MEKAARHRLLNSVLFTALLVPLAFFVLRDTIAVLTGLMFEAIGGKESFGYQINDDLARLIIAGLLLLIMPIFFRGNCRFGFRGGKLGLGILLALPELVVPLWNLLQIKVYHAPWVTGTAAVAAAIIHGIGPGLSEEVFCRGFAVSNLMRIWKDKKNRFLRCMLVSGAAFGLLHAFNAVATGDIFAALIQVIYTAAIGMLNGAIYLRSRNLWGVILLHSLTDVSAFLAVFDESVNATGMDIAFCVFGSLLFVTFALYLIRPAKHAEIDELWADGWSFGDGDEKAHAAAKVTAIVSAVLAVAIAVSLGVVLYQGKMGFTIPFFSAGENTLDKDVRCQIGDDGKTLTVWLPCTGGEQYDINNSDAESFVLKECRESGDTCLFVFFHGNNDTEKVKLTFGKKLGDMPVSIKDYTVTVSFKDDGTIASVGG